MTYIVKEVPGPMRVRLVCEECGNWDTVSGYMSCAWDEQRQLWIGDGDTDSFYCVNCQDNVEVTEEPI